MLVFNTINTNSYIYMYYLCLYRLSECLSSKYLVLIGFFSTEISILKSSLCLRMLLVACFLFLHLSTSTNHLAIIYFDDVIIQFIIQIWIIDCIESSIYYPQYIIFNVFTECAVGRESIPNDSNQLQLASSEVVIRLSGLNTSIESNTIFMPLGRLSITSFMSQFSNWLMRSIGVSQTFKHKYEH